MGLLSKLRDTFGNDSGQTFTYKCSSCETEFTSQEPHMAKVECPGCGSGRAQSITTST